MPFEPGMDSYLRSFAPVGLSERLKLKPPPIRLKSTREKVASWYKVATVLEARKPMRPHPPVEVAGKVTKRVDYAGGNYYVGEWVNGKKHGKGQYVSNTKGFLYKGDLFQGCIQGQGAWFDRKPDNTWFLTYIGYYKRGLRDGWGTYRWSVDEFYEGLWRQGIRDGWGRHFAPDGAIYEGQWRNDQRWGYGATREAYGNHHQGEYKEDKKNGPGKYNYARTGKCFEGMWKNDIPVVGEISQLKRYKPTFPHQYPMPLLGLKDPKAVVDSGILETCQILPPPPNSGLPHIVQDIVDQELEETVLFMKTDQLREIDMRQILTEVEPHIEEITDKKLASEAADYLLAIEYLWRANTDRTQPRPARVQKLLAKNSQELKRIEDEVLRIMNRDDGPRISQRAEISDEVSTTDDTELLDVAS